MPRKTPRWHEGSYQHLQPNAGTEGGEIGTNRLMLVIVISARVYLTCECVQVPFCIEAA